MAESMQGLHRSHRCTEVSNKNIGETVTVLSGTFYSYSFLLQEPEYHSFFLPEPVVFQLVLNVLFYY